MTPEEQKYLDEINWRRGEKGQILQWLQEQGLLPARWQTTDTTRALDDSLKTALASACGRFAAQLVSIQLDDLAGATTPVNIPGTHTEHANWRRKLPLETDRIFDSTIAVNMMKALHTGRQG
jgi:4-alpha-glucanotransferase